MSKPKKNQIKNKTFAHYKIIKKIAAGGMGTVYKARDTQIDRIVALKIISSKTITSTHREQFTQEAQTTAKLNHPNIVKLLTIGETPKNYFTMEFIAGKTLQEIVSEKPPKPIEAAQIMLQVVEALKYSHNQGIIHCDIKPTNIMITGQQVKVMDFGLAKTLGQKAKQAVGTPFYMAPEQVAGKELNQCTDIYGAGATLYEAITGTPPFKGDSHLSLFARVVHSKVIAPSLHNHKIPRDLETICLKCLEKRPKYRYQNAEELADDLKKFIAYCPISARQSNAFHHVYRSAKTHVGSIVVIIFATLFTFFYINWRNQRQYYNTVAKYISEANEQKELLAPESTIIEYIEVIAKYDQVLALDEQDVEAKKNKFEILLKMGDRALKLANYSLAKAVYTTAYEMGVNNRRAKQAIHKAETAKSEQNKKLRKLVTKAVESLK